MFGSIGFLKGVGYAFLGIGLIAFFGMLLMGQNYIANMNLSIGDNTDRTIMQAGLLAILISAPMILQSPRLLGLLIIGLLALTLFFLKQWGVIGSFNGQNYPVNQATLSGTPLFNSLGPTTVVPKPFYSTKSNTTTAQLIYQLQQQGWRIDSALTEEQKHWCKTANLNALPYDVREKAERNCPTGYTWTRE